jgi:hypothetical protein
MILITLFGKDKSKQVIKTTESFIKNPQGEMLTHSKISEKVKEMGHDILKNNYYNSTIQIL